MSVNRRHFLKNMAAVQAGAALSTAAARQTRPPADVIVVGAGAFGGWTAYYLRQLGASVRLVDAYGPGNSRATSGDETRGVRSSYGDRGVNAELWTTWANQRHRPLDAIRRGMGPADEGAAVLQHRRSHISSAHRRRSPTDAGGLEEARDSVRDSQGRRRRTRVSRLRSRRTSPSRCTTRGRASCARGARARSSPRRFGSQAAKC